MERRDLLMATGALALAGVTPRRAAAATTRVKVGYLHTLAVDAQMWLAESRGLWKKHGLEMDYIQFQTGLEGFQAMTGGSIDVLSTGAVLSNFPARGEGKVFLINDIEFATAQLWVHPSMGVKAFADLKGKRISTTLGTTAHVFLDTALRANGVNPADVILINQSMPNAVTAFISKAVAAVALWVPFNEAVKAKSPHAKMLVDASAYYPKDAIVDGWVARNDYFTGRKDMLVRIIKAWAEANDCLISHTDPALTMLQKQHYPQMSLADLKDNFRAEKVFTAAEWRQKYADGTVTKWLQQVTDFFAGFAHIQNPVPASQYFDPSLYLKTIHA